MKLLFKERILQVRSWKPVLLSEHQPFHYIKGLRPEEPRSQWLTVPGQGEEVSKGPTATASLQSTVHLLLTVTRILEGQLFTCVPATASS